MTSRKQQLMTEGLVSMDKLQRLRFFVMYLRRIKEERGRKEKRETKTLNRECHE